MSIAVDYTAYAGDTIKLIVSIVDEDDAALDVSGASATYAISRTIYDDQVVTKTIADGIAISTSTVTITLDPADSELLMRPLGHYDIWHHELELINDGAVNTVLHGNIRIKRTII